METINILSENENYTAVNIGSMNELMKHTLVHSVSGRIVEGKFFYIILRGSGFFQVDDDCFPISEGSVVRVAPKGVRGMSNSSGEAMVYIVIQSRENSLKQYSTGDGTRVEYEKKW